MKTRILDWRARRGWLSSIKHYAGDLLPAELRAELQATRPECWSDNLTWLPDHDDIVPEFCERFIDYYTHIKGFHGCRPTSLISYYENGIFGQKKDHIHKIFREVFADQPVCDLDKAIEQFENRGWQESGKIWLLACDETLLRDCGHYLIQGSEYLMSLAAALCHGRSVGEDYRFRLRKLGIPIVLEVDIPIEFVPYAQLHSVIRMGAIGCTATSRLRRRTLLRYFARHSAGAYRQTLSPEANY